MMPRRVVLVVALSCALMWGRDVLAAEKEASDPGSKGVFDDAANRLDSWLTTPSRFGVELFRSVEEDARPAAFSWSRDKSNDDTYQADAAIRASYGGVVDGALQKRLFGDMTTSFEAHAASGKEGRKSNSLKTALGLALVYHPSGEKAWTRAERRFIEREGIDPTALGTPGVSTLVDVNAEHETNPSTGSQKLGGELLVSLNCFDCGVGRFIPLGTEATTLVSFRWRPYAGFEGGKTIDKGDDSTEGEDSSFHRLTGRMRLDIRLDALSKRLMLSGDAHYWYRFTGDSQGNELAVVSLNYQLAEHVYIGGSFTNGEDSPDFKHDRKEALELGIRF